MSRLDDFRIKAKAEGYNDDEINSFVQQKNQAALNEGYSMDEINDHWGIPKPDAAKEEKLAKDHLPSLVDTEGKPEVLSNEINSFEDVYKHIASGLAHSVTGLIVHGKPMTEAPQNSSMFADILYQLGEVGGDIPAMGIGALAGGIGGGVAGTAVGGLPGAVAGATVGVGAGTFGLPTAIKAYMMDGYQNGSFKDFNDFWSRMAAVSIKTAKSATVGVATELTAGLINPATTKMAEKFASPVSKLIADEMAKVTVMTAAGSAVEGQMPSARDFTESALVVGALHSVGPIKNKVMKTFIDKDIHPSQVALDSEKDPTIKQDLHATNKDLPDAYNPRPVDKEATAALGKPFDPIFTEEEIKSQPPEVKIGKEAEDKGKFVEPKPLSPETTLEESFKAIESQLVTKGGETLSERAKAAKSYFVDSIDNLYTRLVDKFNPIKQAVEDLAQGKPVDTIFDAYKLSRNANDAKAKALYSLKYGTFDFNTMKRNGEGLSEALKPIKQNEMKMFDAFLAANRAVELDARGVKDTGFDIGHAKNLVAKSPEHFTEVAKKVTEYRNRNLDYLVQSGLLAADKAQSFKDVNKLYVPFNRVVDINNEVAIAAKRGNKTFKQLKGANDLKTQSPLQAISNDTATFIQLAEANRARSEMVKMQEATGGEDPLLYRVKAPGKVELTKEAADFLNANGFTTESGDAFQFTRRNADLKENQFEIYRDGEREVWETKDPELAKALKAVDGEPGVRSLVVKLASAISSTIRATTAVTPDFVVRNFLSDQLTAQVLNKHGGFHLPHTVKAIGDLMGKDHSVAWQEFLKSGGASGAFLKLNEEYFNKEIYKLQEETGFMDAAWNAVKSPFKAMEAISSAFEQSTRLAEFKRTTQGDYSINKLFEGGFNAREVTVDFQRMGSAINVLNSITAFQNAGIQGLDRSVRAFNENKGRFAMMAGVTVTAPTLLNYVVNKDDPRYKDAPAWQRDLYWVVPTDSWSKPDPSDDISRLPDYLKRIGADGMPEVNTGITLRIPKPREVGIVFGSFIERSLDAFFEKNPEAFKGFAESVVGIAKPSLLPDVFTPMVETWANKNMFTGDAIVPHSSERLLPRDRYSEYTSELAKKVSTILTSVPGLEHSDVLAPAVIDNWIGDWTGNLGRYVLSGIDWGLKENAPEKSIADIPFVKSFIVRNPSMGSGIMQDFNDRVKNIEEYQASIKKLSKTGLPEDQARAIETQQKLLKEYPDFQRVLNASRAMQNMRRFIHNVYKTPDMTKHEKRQAIDGVYYQMIEMARGTKKATLQADQESEE